MLRSKGQRNYLWYTVVFKSIRFLILVYSFLKHCKRLVQAYGKGIVRPRKCMLLVGLVNSTALHA